jgi:multiple sugar transport system ATP-binding protein
VYHHPANLFVAGFIGSPSMNFVDVTIEEDGTIVSERGVDEFEARLKEDIADQYRDKGTFTLGVRPQYFEAHTERVDNSIHGTVEVTEPQGDEQIIEVNVGDEDDSLIELTVLAPSTVDATRNDDIWLTIKDELVHGFDQQTGERFEVTIDRTDESLNRQRTLTK